MAVTVIPHHKGHINELKTRPMHPLTTETDGLATSVATPSLSFRTSILSLPLLRQDASIFTFCDSLVVLSIRN
jgi:hypothetical protein